MEYKIDETDRISELPLFMLHRILSCLPRKDAARTSVLSKLWNSVWHSFPVFEFRQDTYVKEAIGTPGFAEKFEGFLNSVDKSLHKFSQNELRIETFHLRMFLTDTNSVPMIDTWLPLALHNGVSHIYFRVYTRFAGCDYADCFYPLPETTFMVKSICGSFVFYHLQNLSLSMVSLSENIIRDIIRNCPNISALSLCYFRGLKTLEISKLGRLERLDIEVSDFGFESVSVDASNLKYFRSKSYVSKLPCAIQLTSCHDLKGLCISSFAITDYLFNSLLSRFPFLEHLEISECYVLRKIRISAQWLKSLVLHKCGELEVVQIHAPNLSKFEYNTSENMPILLAENVIPCSVKISYQLIINKNGPVDSFWFLKLREFLGVSAQAIFFQLYVDVLEVSFDPEALRDVATPPPVEVDLLELYSYRRTSMQLDFATLIDGLLWSCRPKAISIRSKSLFKSNCVMVLCEKLFGREEPLCCKSSHFKCWRHSLKEAKIENFGGIEDDRSLHLLLDSLSSLTKDQEVRFRLGWDL